MRRRCVLLVLLAAVYAVLATGCGVAPTDLRCERVGSGHTICEPVLSLYDSMGGPQALGQPLGNATQEDGVMVQYFENVCFEWDPGVLEVRLSPLGVLLGHVRDPIPDPRATGKISGTFEYYPQTGHTVPRIFAAFHSENGGPELLGYPIREFTIDSGRVVQYFERTRLDWYPEESPGMVRFGPLGMRYLRLRNAQKPAEEHLLSGNDGETIDPGTSGGGPGYDQDIGPGVPLERTAEPVRIDLAIKVKYERTGKGGQQTVSVVVKDSSGSGVPRAEVTLVVHERDRDRELALPLTNLDGYASLDFDIGDAPSGHTVLIEAQATWRETKATARAHYTPWF